MGKSYNRAPGSLNKQVFFSYVRQAPFGGRLTEEQVDGTETIIKAFHGAGGRDIRHLAYILATAFHETGGRMVPVREGFAKSDAKARAITSKYKYGKPDPETGHVYYGRGVVQLTWAENYRRMGQILGVDLYHNPDLALDKGISARILVEGMMAGKSLKGDFAGVAVEKYFNDTINDPVGARRIVNGTDKAKLIANHYQNFFDALDHADVWMPELVQNDSSVTADAAAPDRPNLLKDPTTLGTVSAVAGSGVFGIFTAIDSPWAFAAFAVVALGIFLFVTGRIKIIRKAGA